MTTNVLTSEEMMDFSLPPRNLKFKVDADVFEAVPELATERALTFADEAANMDDDDVTTRQRMDIIEKLFHLVLVPESADRLIARLSDPINPIGPERFQRILTYLMEQYGLRPTEPGSDSSPGSDVRETGTNSTASASATGSIFAP